MNPLEAVLILVTFALVRFVLPTSVLLLLDTMLDKRNGRFNY